MFRPGDTICLREIWHGRVWSARPALLVARDEFWTVAFTPSGSIAKMPMDPSRKRKLRIPSKEHVLVDERWRDSTLRFADSRSRYSIMLCREPSDVLRWYLNVEEPRGESHVGFDYRDWFLDVVISPQHGTTRLKDEEELREAVERELMTPGQAAVAYLAVEVGVQRVRALQKDLERWASWMPPNGSSKSSLPPGWDSVP